MYIQLHNNYNSQKTGNFDRCWEVKRKCNEALLWGSGGGGKGGDSLSRDTGPQSFPPMRTACSPSRHTQEGCGTRSLKAADLFWKNKCQRGNFFAKSLSWRRKSLMKTVCLPSWGVPRRGGRGWRDPTVVGPGNVMNTFERSKMCSQHACPPINVYEIFL